MQVTKEPLEPCQVALTIEVEGDKVVHAVDRAYREYAKYVSVPGFRKGKAPLNFVRQRIPESDIRQRTAELLVEPAYTEALEKEDIHPFAAPKLELVQLDLTDQPFIFKAVVPLRPEIQLGTYTGLNVERNKYEMTEADIDKQVERMRERAAAYPKVERPAMIGDIVIADVTAVVEARPEASEPRPTMLELGADNIPGFDEQVVGLSVGESKTFNLTYTDDYPEEDLAGQPAEFTVLVKEVRVKEIPPLNDELAQTITSGRIVTLEGFRADLQADMERSLLEAADRDAEAKLIDQILGSSTVKFPPVLVESEVDDDVKELLARLESENIAIDEYLQRIGKTREQLMAEMQEAAEKRIRIGLTLGEIADKENLTLTDADVEAAIVERATQQETTPAAMRAYLESNDAMTGLRNRAQTKKVLDFLRAAAIIKDKIVRTEELEAEEPSEPVPGSKKKTTAKRGAKTKASDEQ